MTHDRILITKDLVPYAFDISLGDDLFTLVIDYNQTHDFFTVGLVKEDEVICEGEPIVYGFPLFKDIFQADVYPALDIVPLDESGEQTAVTFANFNETVFLTVENYDESEENNG